MNPHNLDQALDSRWFDRAEGLIVNRISDVDGVVMLEGIVQQTYQQAKLRDQPAIKAILAVGMAPFWAESSFTVMEELADGTLRPHIVLVDRIVQGPSKSVIFFYGGYWHLWSLSSATHTNEDGANGFTELTCDLVKRVRPVLLYAASISRLMRDQGHAIRLQGALLGNVDTIIAGEGVFDITGNGTGLLLLQTFAMAASLDRDWIVQRTNCGRIAKWRRNEWPFGERTVPAGYRYDPNSKHLVVRPEMVEVIRRSLVILSGDAPPAEMQRQLTSAGLKTEFKKDTNGNAMSVDMIRDPGALISKLYAWAALWTQGEYLLRMHNGFRGITELNGVEVMRYDGEIKDAGELQMLFTLPVPEGGWAPTPVLEAFARRAVAFSDGHVRAGYRPNRPLSSAVELSSANPALHADIIRVRKTARGAGDGRSTRDGSRARKLVAPLSGRFWDEGIWRYELQVTQAKRYRLIRWVKDQLHGPTKLPAVRTAEPYSDEDQS